MRPLGMLPAWLRRGLEAGLVAALIGLVTLWGSTMQVGTPIVVLPRGLAGSLLLAPAVLSVGVITVGYPIGLGATRSDGLLGSVAAILIAADLITILIGVHVLLPGIGRQAPVGALATVLGLVPALSGLIASQVATPLGFGRRAGAAAVIASTAAATAVLLVASALG